MIILNLLPKYNYFYLNSENHIELKQLNLFRCFFRKCFGWYPETHCSTLSKKVITYCKNLFNFQGIIKVDHKELYVREELILINNEMDRLRYHLIIQNKNCLIDLLNYRVEICIYVSRNIKSNEEIEIIHTFAANLLKNSSMQFLYCLSETPINPNSKMISCSNDTKKLYKYTLDKESVTKNQQLLFNHNRSLAVFQKKERHKLHFLLDEK
jgi:hypothetical protein